MFNYDHAHCTVSRFLAYRTDGIMLVRLLLQLRKDSALANAFARWNLRVIAQGIRASSRYYTILAILVLHQTAHIIEIHANAMLHVIRSSFCTQEVDVQGS